MTTILGISDGHDPGACLINNEKILLCFWENELESKKRVSGFPYLSIEMILKQQALRPEDIDIVDFADTWGRLPFRALNKFYRNTPLANDTESMANKAALIYQNGIFYLPAIRKLESFLSKKVLTKQLEKMYIRPKKIISIAHHVAHAYAAYKDSQTDPLVITLDGYGDGLSGQIGFFKNKRFTPIASFPFWNSLGLIYGALTSMLGFKEGEESKTMELAKKGDPNGARPIVERLIWMENSSIRTKRLFWKKQLSFLLKSYPPEAIAASVQKKMEEVVIALINSFIQTTCKNELCCSGGVFNNTLLVERIKALKNMRSVHVADLPGDKGICIGTALAAYYNNPLCTY